MCCHRVIPRSRSVPGGHRTREKGGGRKGKRDKEAEEKEGRKEGLRTACRLSRPAPAPAPGRAIRERGKGTEQAGSSNQQKTQRQRSEDERCFTTVNQSQQKERDKTTQRTRQTTTVPGKPALFLRGELRRPEAERAPAALRAGAPPHFHSASRPPGMPPRPLPSGSPKSPKRRKHGTRTSTRQLPLFCTMFRCGKPTRKNRKTTTSRHGELTVPLCSALLKTHLEQRIHVWGTQYEKDRELLQRVQEGPQR